MSDERAKVFLELVSREESFLAGMKLFIDSFIQPLYVRDTSFKRNMLDDAHIASCFNLYVDIHAACDCFLASLQASSSELEIAEAITQFAPSLSIFSHFIAEVTSAINSLEKFGRALLDYSQGCLQVGVSPETELASLQEHYTGYRPLIATFVGQTPPGTAGAIALTEALGIFTASCDMVDKRIADEAVKVQLLTLQQQCKFHPSHSVHCSTLLYLAVFVYMLCLCSQRQP